MIEVFCVASLSEFYEALHEITSSDKDKGHPNYWFRGHSYNYYTLLPSLYRGKFYKSNGDGTYSSMNLKENYRYQHIKARAFHNIHTNPQYQSEWQEIYQHHFGRTRLMDWTESARTALTVALEPFIDTRMNKELEYKRQHITPCIWMLDPYKLNEKVYDYFAERFCADMGGCFHTWYGTKLSLNDICQELERNKNIYFDNGDGDPEIKGIISLCAIEDYRRNFGGGVESAVKRYEFNPFYFLALKMYSDAVPYDIGDGRREFLPPIAILHPYHSERIRTQRGAFTMFPNYIVNDKAEDFYKNRDIDVRAMEWQALIQDCLKAIYILNPHRIAKDMVQSGVRRSELYPDIQTYADIIETQEYYYGDPVVEDK